MANTLTFAGQTLTDANIFGGISFVHDLNTGEEFSIGNTASASVSFVTDVQLPLYTKDQTNGKFTWTQDSTARGRYYITEVVKEADKYRVTAYDAMILTDVNVSELSLTLPETASNIATAIATYIGCTVSGTIVNGSLTVSDLDDDCTVRQLLHYVAEASGCSVKIDGSDHLCFMYYASSGITISATQYKEAGLDVADYVCSKIDNVTIFDNVGAIGATAGSGTNTLYIQGNPFLYEATSTEATAILNVVKDFQYAPLRCEMFEENGLEVGTIATFGTTATLVMHLESSETGAVASSVGLDVRTALDKDLDVVVKETSESVKEVKNYFWFTSSDTGAGAGAHITQEAKDNFLNDVAVDPTSGGGNVLIDTNGMKIRDGLTELTTVEASGIQLGEDNKTHVNIDYHSFQMVDFGGDTYVYLSDLRNTSGEATLAETFYGDGSTTQFQVTLQLDSDVSVTIDGVATSAYTLSGRTFTFTSAPADGSEIVITYITTSDLAKAYTLGVRDGSAAVGAMSMAEGNNTAASGSLSHAEGWSTTASGVASHAEGRGTEATNLYTHAEGRNTEASGEMSHAEGYNTKASGNTSHAEGFNTEASGSYSHAQNIGTIAKSMAQTAIGQYNLYTNALFMIGNGSSDSARSNAFEVSDQGAVKCAGRITDSIGRIDHLSVVSDTISIGNLGGNSDTSGNKAVNANDLCIVGWNLTGTRATYVNINRLYVDSGKVYYQIRNLGSSQATGLSLTVYMLRKA